MAIPFALRRALLLPLFLALPAFAVPVAVNDTYTTPEDTPVSPDGPPVLSANFNSGADGFTYADDTFGTSAPNNEAGTHEATEGFNGTGGLEVRIGNRPSNNSGGGRQSSGGWQRTFSLAAPATVQCSGRYRLRTEGGMEDDEYGDLILDVDGTRHGPNGTAPNRYLARLYGPNTENQINNATSDSGWLQFSQNVALTAGSHTLTIGVYNNNSSFQGEIVQLNLDDLVIGPPPGTGTVLANDTGGVAPVTATKLSNPANGTANFAANGNFTYTPNVHFFGTDSFTYRASDGTGNSNTATVTINVTAVNDAPAGGTDSYTTAEDTPLTVSPPGVLTNDTDVDNAQASLTAGNATTPANGTLAGNGNGGFIYTPRLNFSGTDFFTYQVSDGALSSSPVAVNLTITPVPDAPQPAADEYYTPAGSALIVTQPALPAGTLATLITAAPETADGGTAQPGDLWKYLDNGTDQGIAWRALAFDDTSWKSGRGELGYGDATGNNRPEYTVVEDNPTPGYTLGESNRYITHYFRKVFTIADHRKLSGLSMSLLRDDGAVVWLNGNRVYVENGLDTATYLTLAAASTGNEATHITVPLTTADQYLQDGDNILAVEIHQSAPDTSDMSFDLGLSATERPYAGVLANDVEPEGQPMTATVGQSPAHGALSFNANGTFTYTPAAGYQGPDSFTYTATDGALTSPPATVTITVGPPENQPPVAQTNNYNATEDTVLNVSAANGVLTNDTDPEGQPLTALLVSAPANGVLSLAANGSFTFTPALNFNGGTSFTYRASDGVKQSPITAVTLTVAAVPDAPLAVADTYRTTIGAALTVSSTAPGGITPVTLITAAPETVGGIAQPGDVWRFLDNGTDQGTAWRDVSFDDSAWVQGAGELGYGDAAENRPEVTQVSFGLDSSNKYVTTYFRKSFAVADRLRVSNLAISLLRDDGAVVYLNGNPIHVDPNLDVSPLLFSTLATGTGNEATHDSYPLPNAAQYLQDGVNVLAVEVHQNTRTSSDVSFDLGLTADEAGYAGVLYNDTDPEGNPFTASVLTQPANGVLTFAANGTFTYTPNAGYSGTDTFTYRASDATGPSAPATVSIIVSSGPNQQPAAVADTYTAIEDALFTRSAALGVLANDTDPEGDPITAVLVATTTRGALTLNADGSFTYLSAANYSGPDSFTYRARDNGNRFSATVTVNLTVSPSNDTPAALADSYGTDPGVMLSVPIAQGVLGNDSDLDGDALTAQLIAPPASGSLSLLASGAFNYTPAAAGTFTFTYAAHDGTIASAPATVTLIVNGRPVAAADTFSTAEDTPLARNAPGVMSNDTDPEGSPLTAAVVTQPANGALSFAANGSFTYTPAANYSGPDSFTYTISDGSRTSLPGTVSLTVTPVNDAPVAAADGYGVLKDTPLVMSAASGVLANDTDVEGSTLSAALVATTTNGTLTLNSNGSFTYTPNFGFTGADSFTYRAADGALQSAVTTVSLAVTTVTDTVLISEIMFNPVNGLATQEYIELLNFGTLPVDLGGWKFTAGVNFTIPAATLVAAGARLVIPADRAAFDARWPGITNRLATGWNAALSGLSNSGETIRLQRPDFAQPGSFIEVDQVDYSDEGEWGTRQIETVGNNTGWRWNNGADGGGMSLQLRTTALSNNRGQNWLPAAPTPGAANTAVAAANLAPVILNVKHSPAVPGPTEQVHITCDLENEIATGLSASVFWRLAVATPAAFTSVQMFDDGLHSDGAPNDGEFGGALPAQAAGSIVEFYVTASDGTLTRAWPAPALSANGTPRAQDASANCFYQVDTEAWTGNQPIYRLIMSEPEGTAFVATTYDTGEASDTDKNVTVIFAQGADTDIRYQSGVRYRGAGSRGSYRPHNWKLNLPHDRPWQDWTNLNLNSLSAHVLTLGSRLMQGAGMVCEIATPAAVRLNASNRMTTGSPSGVAVYGLYSHQTPMGSEWAAKMIPSDPGGNLYKKARGSGTGWQFYESAPGVPNIGGYQSAGWFKETNVTANDWNDLNTFCKTIRAATNIATTPPSFDFALGSTVADLEQWARWWAFCVIINHRETNLSCGVDDDYSLYLRKHDGRCMLLQHDFDTILSAGDTGTSATATIWQAYDTSFVAEKTFASYDIPRALFFNNTFVRRFKWHLRNLLTTTFAQPNFDAVVESTLGVSTGPAAWVPQTERDRLKTFMNARRTYILTQVPATFTAATTLPVSNGYPTTTVAHDTLLSGNLDGALTDRVLINGVPAVLNNHDNNWTAAGIPAGLLPGLNTVNVQALDAAGSVLASQTFSILYDDGSVATKTGSLSASETWTAAGGPYLISGSLVVSEDVTLTIQPGTSVYLGSGANLNVDFAARLIADGTPERPIRFTRPPGSAGGWGGITANGATEVRISNAVIELHGGTGITISGGTVATLDRINFLNNTRASLQLDNSSWTVSNCTFPAMAAGSTFTPVSGSGVTGQAVLRDCTFGAVMGNNDAFRFTGGHRPGPVLRILNNTFNGSGDDLIELSSADAWIEGNVFLHAHKNGGLDSAAAVATADTGGGKSEVTLIRNLIYDCDNAVTVKQGNSAALLYNTIARITKTGGTETVSGVVNLADTTDGTQTGAGAVLTGNIITDVESLARQYYPASSSVTFSNNLQSLAWSGPGTGNTVAADAMLNLGLITTPATATAAQVRAALTLQWGSPANESGLGGNDKGASFPAGIAASGEPLQVTALNTVTLIPGPAGTIAAPGWNFGYTHYRWSADGVAWSTDIPAATPLSLTGLADGLHSIHLTGKDDSGAWQTTPTVFHWRVAATMPGVILSEILAENGNAYALGSTRPDVIELHNYGPAAVSLAGFGLTDETDTPYKFTFPPGTGIPAGGYLLVMADSLPPQNGELHTGFGLDAGGETITLTGSGGMLLDRIAFGPQISGRSIARSPTLPDWWGLATFTPGAANTIFSDFGPPSGIRLNEWLAANDFIVEGDFVELYNTSAKPVHIGGMMLTDNFMNLTDLLAMGDSSVHVIPMLSFIPANGFVRFLADGDAGAGGDHLSFKLAEFHETLGLADGTGTPVDYAVLSIARQDISEGRITDGGIATSFFTVPTPGFSNTTDLTTEVPLRNALRITELMYNPTSSAQPEFIELRNTGTVPLDLTGVNFTSGISFTFPALTLAPGAYTVITDHAARFAATFPGITTAGVYSGKLDNGGERVRLELGGFPVGILDFSYSDTWYPLTDGQGASLQIVDATRAATTWGDRASWQAGAPSPGTATAFGVIAGADRRVAWPAAAVLDGTLFTGNFNAGDITIAWSKVSGPGTASFTAPANPDTNVSFTAAGVYELRITATAPGPVTVTDTVTVVSEESYDAWALRLLPGPVPADRLRTADPDRDGLVNLAEHVLGTNPAAADAATAWTLSTTGGFLTLEYRRPLTVSSAIQVIPQIAADLTAWDESPASVAHALQSTAAGHEIWRAWDPRPLTPGQRRYLRLKILAP